jgi:hypothetical protein
MKHLDAKLKKESERSEANGNKHDIITFGNKFHFWWAKRIF